MDTAAHALWAGAAAIAAQRKGLRISLPWTAFWATFPDLLALGPPAAYGLWLRFAGEPVIDASRQLEARGILANSLYARGHSLFTFGAVFLLACVAARRPVWSLLGWLSHILIDIPTHEARTPFLWPYSDFGLRGYPWRTPWFWAATYVALVVVYGLLWKKGWLKRQRPGAGAKLE